jgi:hypothetical protein
VFFEGMPLIGLSVMRVAPVLTKPDGLVPVFANLTTASTPISAIFFGNCITVAAKWPALTSATPSHDPSMAPTRTLPARPLSFSAW